MTDYEKHAEEMRIWVIEQLTKDIAWLESLKPPAKEDGNG